MAWRWQQVRQAALMALLVAAGPSIGRGEARFPQPDLPSGYVQPVTTTAAPRAAALEYLDVAVLLGALALAAYLALRKRSRKWLFMLMVFSVLYFGFWRKGCICPIGSIQNVTLALSDNAYTLPLTVLLFFFLPLLFALFFGRIFCAAVCPLGGVQDLVALNPLRLPPWLSSALGIVPYLYLGVAVLLAACGAGFIVCRYDPFVSFFRLSGSFPILTLGAAALAVGIFIARPYCRFFCPYGVLLNWASRFSRRHVAISPDECIQCRLCERACPFDAIQAPSTGRVPEGREAGRQRLALLAILFPVLILGGGWAGSKLATPLSLANPTVRLAWEMKRMDAGTPATSLEAAAFLATGRMADDLHREADALRKRFGIGSRLLGGFMGLVVGCTLVGLSTARQRKDYEPDRASCLGCGRCFLYCPREHLRLKKGMFQDPTLGR